MQSQAKSVSEYIASLPEDRRAAIKAVWARNLSFIVQCGIARGANNGRQAVERV